MLSKQLDDLEPDPIAKERSRVETARGCSVRRSLREYRVTAEYSMGQSTLLANYIFLVWWLFLLVLNGPMGLEPIA